MKWQGLFVVLAAGVASVALAPSAGAGSGAATKTVKGKTSQNLRAYVRIRANNSVARVGVRYKAKCRKRGRFVTAGLFWQDTASERGFERNGTAFSDGGRTRARSGGYRLIIDSTMSGAPAGSGWAGRFKVRVTVKNRRGRTSDVCKTGSRSWNVPAPPG